MARDRKKAIIALLKAFETETLIQWWNNYCTECNMDDYIWGNDENNLNEMFNKADEALRAACYGDYRYSDEYYIINAYGNLQSFDGYDAEKYVDFDVLADYIMENGCYEITEVWMEDLIEDFLDYASENSERELTEDDYYELIDGNYSLVTDDWDTILNELNEKEDEE